MEIIFSRLLSKLYLRFTNKKYDRFIFSSKASKKAKYGIKVLIDKDTYVSDDVEIGNYSYINRNSSIESCSIGKFCSISSNVFISPFNHDYSFVSTHPFLFNSFYGMVNKTVKLDLNDKKTIIGNDVWIGLNVIIRRGITIGDGVVIAAGSIVTSDIPSYQIWAGVPAKFVKHRFPDNISPELQKLSWWDWDDAKLMKYMPLFRAPADLLEQIKIDGNNA